jgi:hypothetical protein
VPLRPFTVADVLDGGITALKVAPGQLLAVTVPFILPVQILAAVVARTEAGSDPGVRDSFATGMQGLFTSGVTAGAVVVDIIASVALTFAGAAVARVVCSWYVDRPEPTRTALRAAVRRTPALVVLWLLVHLTEVASAFPLGITALFVVPYFVAAAPILAVESAGPWTAFRRCFRLTRRRYGFAFGVVVMVALLDAVIGGVSFALAFVAQGAVEAAAQGLDLGTSWVWVVGATISAAAALVVVPFVCATSALVYLDQRVRNEGLDIELAAIEQFGAS